MVEEKRATNSAWSSPDEILVQISKQVLNEPARGASTVMQGRTARARIVAIVGAVQRPDGAGRRAVSPRLAAREPARRGASTMRGRLPVPARPRRRVPRAVGDRRRADAAHRRGGASPRRGQSPTTALTAAACAEGLVPAIASLYVPATAAQRHCDLTLLTAL